MPRADTDTAPYHFKEGDRVRVRDAPNLFYSRTQMYVRGVTGTIAERSYQTLAPEDEAWNRDDAPPQQFYIVRFRQKDLWPEYPFDNDTLQTELPEGWLEAAR
jgi:thiocyanate hydrolase subunit beta